MMVIAAYAHLTALEFRTGFEKQVEQDDRKLCVHTGPVFTHQNGTNVSCGHLGGRVPQDPVAVLSLFYQGCRLVARQAFVGVRRTSGSQSSQRSNVT